ncbi:hypothetical protein HPB47_014449 [Ixodes persulcatus]|uniref:Uncharacterized protein n=1 Tax=Ixodes persulcatus TaxID=34615 RepID=A0AC60QW23_IXOPE|nr:hypothetical protein HPB47_014449 [Ixodes persulcatus]
MDNTVEGENIWPSELETGEWETVLSLQDRARRLKGDAAAASTSQRMHGGGKSASNAPIKKKRPPAPRRKAPLPRLPASDYTIVCRPRGWNLNTFVPRQLERAACDAVHVSFDVAQTEDSARVNPTNNTLTLSTPDRQRAAAYASLQTLRIEGRDFEVASYVAAPDDSVRGVIYQAFDGSSPDEVRQCFMNRNPGVIVVDARRLGQSKKVGHQAYVCFKPKAYLCRRCGENHPAPPEGELPTCKPVCIVCHGAHNTGSRNCNHRLVVRNQPKKKDDAVQPGGGHQSRSRARSSSMTRRGSKTRDRSSSFPPLMGAASKERKRSSSRGRSASRSKNKMSWPDPASQPYTARQRELKAQLQSRDQEVAALKKEMADMRRLVQTLQEQVHLTAMKPRASASPTCSASSSVSNAMDTNSRTPTKRPPSPQESAGPRRLAEASEVDTPQPTNAPSKLRSDINAL